MDEFKGFLLAWMSDLKPMGKEHARWKLLENGMIKENWDCDTCAKSQKMRIGLVICDLEGKVLACLSSSKEPCAQQPILAKCWALLHAIEFRTKLGLQWVHLEGDALTLIKATQQEERCCTWYDDIIEDIKQTLCYRPTWAISFIHRDGNGVAHLLAKLGFNFSSEHVWMEDYPSLISQLLIFDLPHEYEVSFLSKK